MKRVLLTALLLVSAVAATAALSSIDDTFLFSPPEAAAEGFLRELQTKRFEEARAYLSDRLRDSYDSASLEEWFHRLERETGKIEEVEGKDSTIEGGRAIGRVELKTARTIPLPMALRFVREKREWKVEELPEPAPREIFVRH